MLNKLLVFWKRSKFGKKPESSSKQAVMQPFVVWETISVTRCGGQRFDSDINMSSVKVGLSSDDGAVKG